MKGFLIPMDSRDARLSQPAYYDIWIDDTVRFSDQDAGGHINNTAIAQYVENGRVGFLQQKLQDRPGIGRFVAANLSINYLREEHYPGAIRIGTRVVRLGTKSFTLGFGVFKDGQAIACGTATMVYLEGPKSTALPPVMRRQLAAELVEN